MRAHRLLLALSLLAACGGGEPAGTADGDAPERERGRQRKSAPNLLLITIDTLRADHLGCYGYFRHTSPNIDAFAAESIFFERCLAPMATTLPSHTSMLTGRWPHEHGVLANLQGPYVYERDPSLRTLTEYLRGNGYLTAAFVSCFPLRAGTGVESGFHVYDAPLRIQRRGDETTALALRWLEARRGQERPFFLWVHYFDPHSPYLPPPPHDTLFATDERLLERIERLGIADLAQRPTGQSNEAAAGVNAYDGEVHFTDAQVGILLDAARATGEWDDTCVVLIADHGEGLNQHGHPGHGDVWGEQLHVPFMIRVPGAQPRRVETLVSAVDLIPILLGELDLPRERRLLAQVSGATDAREARETPLLAQSSPRQSATGHIDYALTSGRWKYVRRAEGPELLFDLTADPHELSDVAAEHPTELAALRDQLDEILARQRTRAGGRTREATAEELDKLRALGYGGDEEGD